MATIDRLLKQMVDANASDLHLNSNTPPTWRLHGTIMPIDGAPVLSGDQVMTLITEIMPQKNREQYEKSNDTDFAYEVAELGRFRANGFRDLRGPGAVLRLIPREVITAEDLQLSRAIVGLCHMSKGIVVVTGPTGSGKSTTLCAMIDYINRTRNEHIITIEDPIEFVHQNKKCLINQRQVGDHTDSFKIALRAALREDPDIMLVGEMRDLETIETAIETAETGHLVFGTLHTNTAASTVERIIEQFPSGKQNQIRQMLSSSLKGVIAQTLLRKADGTGRVAAMEVLIVNQAISNIVREGKTHQIASAIQTGGREGMITLNDALVKLVTSRKVSSKEAFYKAVDKEDFQKRMAQTGMALDIPVLTPAPTPALAPRKSVYGKQIAPSHQQKVVEERPMTIRSKPFSTDDFKSFREKMFQKKGH